MKLSEIFEYVHRYVHTYVQEIDYLGNLFAIIILLSPT